MKLWHRKRQEYRIRVFLNGEVLMDATTDMCLLMQRYGRGNLPLVDHLTMRVDKV